MSEYICGTDGQEGHWLTGEEIVRCGDCKYFEKDATPHDEWYPHFCAKHDGKLPVIISVYGIGWDDNYADAEKREPIFSGTAYEYIERFGKEQ